MYDKIFKFCLQIMTQIISFCKPHMGLMAQSDKNVEIYTEKAAESRTTIMISTKCDGFLSQV